MKSFDLGRLDWQLSGWMPEMWRLLTSMELGSASKSEVAPIPCRVPGSVQAALLKAGLIPDWNVGLNSRACEWVENRHWIFETTLPEVSEPARLRFEGLDGPGEIWIDDRLVLEFDNAFVPCEADVTTCLGADRRRTLKVVFHCPPRWLGQCGFTSKIGDWKPRFNYTWDWIPRNVQIGIFGPARLLVGEPGPVENATFSTSFDPASGEAAVRVSGLSPRPGLPVSIRLLDGETPLASAEVSTETFTLEGFSAQPWQPGGNDAPKLYRLEISSGPDTRSFRAGFRHIEWLPCEGAAPDADPWICRINGRDTFLQGINWTPIRPNFADLKREDYEVRLKTYRSIGMNCIRVWGGGFSEHSWLYDLCDELGLLVWQDFPLSSSGVDNWPPEDPSIVKRALDIAEHYIRRLQPHASLFLWCGGNELQGALDGGKAGIGKPCDLAHPLLSEFQRLVLELDPERRFVASTSSGPRFMAEGKDFGKNLHWDVHGPWVVDNVDLKPWQDYWIKDDALFRSEMGNPGAQPADLMRRYLGDCDFRDATLVNPYWNRVGWWFEMDQFLAERGGSAWEIEDYVAWSQQRQASKLAFAVRTIKARFPRCGGMILWMGHDAFPCPINTSLLDFHGRKKPVCDALAEVLRDGPGLCLKT